MSQVTLKVIHRSKTSGKITFKEIVRKSTAIENNREMKLSMKCEQRDDNCCHRVVEGSYYQQLHPS